METRTNKRKHKEKNERKSTRMKKRGNNSKNAEMIRQRKNKEDGIQRSHSILSWIEAPSGPHTKNTRGTIGFVRVKGRKKNSRYNGTVMACKWEEKKRARVQWKGRVSLGRKKNTWVQFIFFLNQVLSLYTCIHTYICIINMYSDLFFPQTF